MFCGSIPATCASCARRLPRASGMVQVPERPSRGPYGPTSARMTACEVVAWIAGLGPSKTKAALDADADALRARWTDADLRHVVAALKARATGRVLPISPDGQYAAKIVSPAGAPIIDHIHAEAERRLGRPINPAELAAMADTDLRQCEAETKRFADAARELLEALRAGLLTAHGVPSDPTGRPVKSADHEAVPMEALLHADTAISLHGYIGVDDGPDYLARQGRVFWDVSFASFDVLGIWPPEYPGREVEPASIVIDDAISRIMKRTGELEAPAISRLLAALSGGLITTWGGAGAPSSTWPPARWQGAHIDLLAFRASGGRMDGLTIGGQCRHLHFARLNAGEFEAWLNGVPVTAKTNLPQFDVDVAARQLMNRKLSGEWPTPPTEPVTRAYLLQFFSGVPNGKHKEARHKVWRGQIKQGPRVGRARGNRGV